MDDAAEARFLSMKSEAMNACARLGFPAPQPDDLTEEEVAAWEEGVQAWTRRVVRDSLGEDFA
jgi:hypothetical protein